MNLQLEFDSEKSAIMNFSFCVGMTGFEPAAPTSLK